MFFLCSVVLGGGWVVDVVLVFEISGNDGDDGWFVGVYLFVGLCFGDIELFVCGYF